MPQLEASGFPVHCLGMQTNHHLPLMLPRLQALQRQYNFDLIHADMPLAGILARLVGRWQRVPVVYTEHNLQERYHPLTRQWNALTYSWNRAVLAVSQEVAESLGRSGLERKTRVTTLLNGVPVEQVRAEVTDLASLQVELEIPADHLVVGTVAVFRRQKRLEDWLQVAAQVAARRQDVTFLLVGGGPEAATIKAKISELGLTGRVCLPGFRPDGRRLMGLMDIYLMTSEFEGLPIALLEAMALGKPVVSTAVGGIPELVQAGVEGCLTPVGDIQSLANHTLQLLADPERCQQMGQQGARRVETQFHIRGRVRAIEDLYLEVLQEAPERNKKVSRLLRT